MLWLFLFSSLVAYTSCFRSVCYYSNWAQYRHGKGTFYPENVDPFLCTHVIYAFAKPVGFDIQPFEWNDDSTEWSEGMYSRIMKLKEKNPNLKILLAVGGYNMGSTPFIPLVQSPTSRVTFANNAVTFLRKRGFDGLDMDWEYPSAAYKAGLVLLMQQLRETFEAEAVSSGKSRLLLSGALPAGKPNIDAGYDVPNLAKHMDFMSIMTYDLHGSWEPYTGLNSPLYAHDNEVGDARHLNLDWAMQYYVTLGAPRDKLNVGIATYGRSFMLDNPSQHDIGSPASQPGTAGLFTGENGFISYYEVCDHLHAGATIVDVPSQANRYMYQDRLWVGYDDIVSVREKACYTKKNSFGGVMFWALDLDDFSGQTCNQGTYPLITAANTEMKDPSLANCVDPSTNPGMSHTTQPSITFPHTPATASIIQTQEFDCTNKADDFYPDPNSCNHFFVCTNQVAYKAHCGGGLMFSLESKHCENAYLVTCNVIGTTSPTQGSIWTSPAHGTVNIFT